MASATPISTDSLPEPVADVCAALNRIARAVIVGGYIRDTALGHSSYDIDIEIYDQPHMEVLELQLQRFGTIRSVGKSFGVLIFSYKEYHFDITLARLENKISAGHKGFRITAAPDAPFEEIAQRRDFTINAMGLDTRNNCFLDPFNGLHDLKERKLELVNKERFAEDPLRILRALSFIGRFELQASQTFWVLARQMLKQGVLQELAVERIYSELEKWLIKSPRPSNAFELFELLMPYLFPKLAHSLQDRNQKERTSKALDCGPKSAPLLFALLFHSLQREEALHELQRVSNDKSMLHFTASLYRAAADYDGITRLPQHEQEVQLHLLAHRFALQDLYAYLSALDLSKAEQLKKQALDLDIFDRPRNPLLTGNDLINAGLSPSKSFKELLEKAFILQLQHPHADKSKLLKMLLKY